MTELEILNLLLNATSVPVAIASFLLIYLLMRTGGKLSIDIDLWKNGNSPGDDGAAPSEDDKP